METALAVDEDDVHVRIYSNRFSEIPTTLDSSTLFLAPWDGRDDFGIGHTPIAIEGFWKDTPVFIKKEPVKDDELEGYRIYLERTGRG